MKTRFVVVAISLFLMGALGQGCDIVPSSDTTLNRQQETLMGEAVMAVGMPAIHNLRERRMLKDILELRDQDGLTTYTYLWNEFNGKLVFFGETIGYGIPYATQYTSPAKYHHSGATLPQADPNGLFSPQSAEGTWVLMKDPKGNKVLPIYVEPRIIVSPFRLDLP